MERTPVESSQIKSVGFDAEARQIEVEFKGGSVYRYDNVEQEIFDAFASAESKGKFFGEQIKKFPERYPFTKIRGTDREEAKKAESEGRAA